MCPPVKVTDVVLNDTVSPVAGLTLDVIATAPANPALSTAAAAAEGRLPNRTKPVAVVAGDVIEAVLPEGWVMLKSSGLTITVTAFVRVCVLAKTPFAANVATADVLVVYCPTVVVGRRRPFANVYVAEPEPPARVLVLLVTDRAGTVAGEGVVLARVTEPVYPDDVTVAVAVPLGVVVGHAVPCPLAAGHQ